MIVRVCVVTPVPRQSGHGSSMTDPVPRHSRHGSLNANAPWLRVISPVPRQAGHCRGAVPGRDPLPPQVRQLAGLASCSGTVTPRTASGKSRVTSVSTSAPRDAPGEVPRPGLVPAPRPPKMPAEEVAQTTAAGVGRVAP